MRAPVCSVAMNRTETPPLDDGALHRLWDYTNLFRPDFRFRRQAEWAAVYLRACSRTASARASSPWPLRVPLPPDLGVHDPEQALQQFVNQSTWDEQAVWKRYRIHHGQNVCDPARDLRHRRHQLPQAGQALRRRPAAVLRGAGQEGQLPGRRLGPLRQPQGHYPLAMRLYLPESWLGDPERLDKAGVPASSPPDGRPRGRSPWSCSTRSGARGCPASSSWPTPATASRRSSATGWRRAGLYYIVGVTDEMVVFTAEPAWVMPSPAERGRPRKRPRLAEDHPRPEA